MSRSYDLRATRQALADLDLKDWAGASFDVEAEQHRHVVLAAFATKRGRSPRGQEPTLGVKGEVYNLHAQNPWRAVTWFDTRQNVCWLLAASAHNYKLFEQRSRNGTLGPTEEDYADLALSRDPAGLDDSVERFLELLAADAPKVAEAAFAAPNTEVHGKLAGTVDVAMHLAVVVVDAEDYGEVYIAFRMPPREGFQLPEDLVATCTAFLLPEADAVDVDWWCDSFPRPGGRRHDEHVVRWRMPAR